MTSAGVATDCRSPVVERGARFFGGWGGAALLVIAVLLICNLTLLVGYHSGVWDASDFFCPYFMLISDHARAGQLLLWTPLVDGGSPAGFDPEVGALSPLTVGLAALLGPHERAFCVYWLIIWALAGLGILVLARHYRAPKWMGCAAAIGYMFSATFTGEAEYTTYLTVMAMLPWTLWRLEVAVESRRLLPAVEAGAIWGLTALSGYPALIIIGYCYLAVWMLGRLTLGSPNWLSRKTLKSFLIGTVFVGVSLPILAPAYVGFLSELRGYSDRSGAMPREEAVNSGALSPKALSTFASPFVAIAAVWEGKRLWDTDIAMSSIYLSPAIFVLALVAPWMRPRDGFRWWLAGMCLVCLAAAVGGALPLRGWLYDWLPPMRYFRHAAMFRCFYMFTAVMLAIPVSRDLRLAVADGMARRWKWVSLTSLAAAGAALATLIAVCVAAHVRPGSRYTALLAVTHVLLVWGGTAVIMAMGWKNILVRRSSLGRHLIKLCVLDAVLTVVLSRPTMYVNRDNYWSKVEAAHDTSIDQTPQALIRRNPTSSVVQQGLLLHACLVDKFSVLKTFNPLRNVLYEESMKQPVLAAAALGNDRIWFAAQASREPFDLSTARRLAARSANFGSPCLILSDPGNVARELRVTAADSLAHSGESLEQLPPAVRCPVELRRYDGRCLDFNVTCPDDGWLLVTDRWAPGWRAWVNGVGERVWIGNLVFRAVAVQRGVNRVCFLYCPWGYPWLVVGSWLALAVVASGSVWAAVCRKRFSDSRPDCKLIPAPNAGRPSTLHLHRLVGCTPDLSFGPSLDTGVSNTESYRHHER